MFSATKSFFERYFAHFDQNPEGLLCQPGLSGTPRLCQTPRLLSCEIPMGQRTENEQRMGLFAKAAVANLVASKNALHDTKDLLDLRTNFPLCTVAQPVGIRQRFITKVLADRSKQRISQLVPFPPMPEVENRRFVRNRFTPEINSDKAAQGSGLVQRFFGTKVGQVEPVLQEVDAQPALQTDGRTASTCLGIKAQSPHTAGFRVRRYPSRQETALAEWASGTVQNRQLQSFVVSLFSTSP